MDFTETLVRTIAQKTLGTLNLSYAGKPVDLATPFQRLTIREAIISTPTLIYRQTAPAAPCA